MAWAVSTDLAVAMIFLVATVSGTPGVERYQDRHSKTIQQQQSKASPMVQREGVCLQEVPVIEITRGSYQVIGNASDPTKSIIFGCCAGYKKVMEGVCEPICERPCRNGKCVRPNECRCFFGFVMNMAGECVTTCPFDCLNGRCDMYDNCNCNPGFLPDRTKKFCVPYCDLDCGFNGNCTAPNTCGCKTGYGWNLNLQCEPQCHPPCGAGICIAPGTCQCQRGFRLIDRTCQANCTRGCEHGRCVANEVCSCDIGWTLNSYGNKCEPVCEKGCQNGLCISPNNCKCLEGFKKLSQTSNVCTPDCKRPCINGNCVAPNVCACNPGYTLSYSGHHCKKVVTKEGFTYVEKPMSAPGLEFLPVPQHQSGSGGFPGQVFAPVPVPIQPIFNAPLQVMPTHCNPNCENGACVGPNQCNCFPGYTKDAYYNHKCIPAHAPGPVHVPVPQQSHSGSGGFPGQVFAPVPVPQPIQPIFNAPVQVMPTHCNPNCENGSCVGPNQCNCLPGYTKDPYSHHKCNPVHIHKSPTQPMQPIQPIYTPPLLATPFQCFPNCINATCVGPNQCNCLSGYTKDQKYHYKCKPVCANGCYNGVCVAPSVCRCNKGYEKRGDICAQKILTTRRPEPRCTSRCVNGDCVGINKCQCKQGYITDPGNHLNCLPYCQGGCKNSTCVSPDNCACLAGFQKKTKNACTPIPTTPAPPRCQKQCMNGHCVGYNKCQCNRGYTVQGGAYNVCKPVCHGCVNGQCTSPNVCLCNAGYHKVNNVCKRK